MKILLDGLPLRGLLTGVSRYVRSLYGSMNQLSGVETAYFNGYGVQNEMPEQADPARWIRLTDAAWAMPAPITAAYQALQWLRVEAAVRKTQKSRDFDVYHGTAFTPAKAPHLPQVFTLHDLSLIRLRRMHPKERVMFADLFFRRRMRWAARIITPTEYIRTEAIEELGLDPEIVTSVPEAPDPMFRPAEPDEVERVRKKHNLPQEYLLFVGALEPRKNIDALIEALPFMRSEVPLALTGWKGWGDKPWLARARELGVDRLLHQTGYVADADLPPLYSGAAALVYPSVYEGFGLPVLEAMACGCPVVCSNAGSLPEVAGNAALLADPHDHEGLARAVDTALHDSQARERMVRQGLDRAAGFTWQAAAEQTLAVMRQAVEAQG